MAFVILAIEPTALLLNLICFSFTAKRLLVIGTKAVVNLPLYAKDFENIFISIIIIYIITFRFKFLYYLPQWLKK
jgi:hypothetical protein